MKTAYFVNRKYDVMVWYYVKTSRHPNLNTHLFVFKTAYAVLECESYKVVDKYGSDPPAFAKHDFSYPDGRSPECCAYSQTVNSKCVPQHWDQYYDSFPMITLKMLMLMNVYTLNNM